MAEQDLKNNTQRNPQQAKENPLDRSPTDKITQDKVSESAKVLQNNRIQNNDRQLAFNAIFAAAPAATNNKAQSNPTTARTQKNTKETRNTRSSSSTASAAEIREQIAVRTSVNTQRNTANTVAGRATANAQAGAVANIDANTTTGQDEQNLQHSGMTDTSKNSPSLSTNQNAPQVAPSNEAALGKVNLNPSTETVKLLDLVGPAAVLSFREALQQVWVNIDANATKDLDVVARMPATMTGMSAMDLLMVESPQGIHFVAFLKNSNDFDVLATFDRRALLPDSPSRQLLEAALMSYEQLDTVFKTGGQKLESKLKELAASRGTSDQVFQELQRLVAQEKRRRRKFKGMIDHLLDQLDMLDIEEDTADAPFVPKDKLSGIGAGRLEEGLEEAEDLLPGLNPEDDDFH
jgi:hypothetical protein